VSLKGRFTIAYRENHPVVHVAYEDALAYARWLGRGLPTEAQWSSPLAAGASVSRTG
jgi:formylglycine-generating enzyme required for sulfatase activity